MTFIWIIENNESKAIDIVGGSPPLCTTIAIYISKLVLRATSYINGEPPHIKKVPVSTLNLSTPVVGSYNNIMVS